MAGVPGCSLPTSTEDLSPEEVALQDEIASLKAQLEAARKEVADTDFYTMTKEVVELGRLKFKFRKTLRGHIAKVASVRWASDSQLILSAGQDGKLIVWDGHTANKVRMIPLKTAWVLGCAISPSMHQVVSGGLDNLIAVFSLNSPEGTPAQLIQELSGHNGYISSLDYIDETKLLSASGDKTLGLWDMEKGELVSTFSGHTNDVNSVRVCRTNKNLAVSVSSDYTCRTWDIRCAKSTQLFEGHEQDVNGVDIFPSGQAFATSSDDTSCRLWDIRSDQAVAAYVDEFIQCGSTCVALSRSGRVLIAGYDDFNCHVWDVLREERVGIMSAHDARVSSLSVNEVGNAIVTGSWDSLCYVWTAK
ncbi:Guanine nucleotide-binding protein subunit beta [Echinococcus granulosus]|uniref:Guanine nucleotide-binding protein subunit beta n=1 Tax=Echinococcus granulosus TaxID=6210 RepID=U6J2Y8_ECHGR|nr:Guanine nucleotide-binding protein subunit beta [Echinococcus granulosus]EUB61828.1 Guanine nucleotide-binding protein subunit beta [Echinococcus granulosus]KAH9281549.1 Guanine nucleotide-binding protein subunit beta [Echinococcus granulosus]CDS18349.1 guanine nucleotide binding protein subunit beta [Echinococcus granulosus]